MRKIKKFIKKDKGFTLLEMSLVLFIISALLLLFVPNIADRRADADSTGEDAIVTVLQTQVDMYTMDKKVAPKSFEAMKTAKYLTENQQTEADLNYSLVDGVVKPKVTPPE